MRDKWISRDAAEADVERWMPPMQDLAMLCLPPIIDQLDPLDDLLPTHDVVAAIVQHQFANDPWLQEIGKHRLTDDKAGQIAAEILRQVEEELAKHGL